MSNKSYQSKENPLYVPIQGGDKKVMKKILSVALSTAMAFSMFAGVAFGDDNLTAQQKFDVLKEAKVVAGYPDGQAHLDKELTRAEFAKVVTLLMGLEPIQGTYSFKDKNYNASNWAVPYIEAVYAANLMEGKSTTKMIFDYNGKISVQEMATVLVRALKLEIPAEVNNNASTWAKGYVQAAINANIISASANPTANATRSQMVDTAYAIYLAEQQPQVMSYEVSENGKVVTFKLANNEAVKVTLETALAPNKATEVKFSNGGYDYTESVTWVVTDATKVENVSASNLREVVVGFDGEVDPTTAEDESNYSIAGFTVKNADLSNDRRTVTLTVADSTNANAGLTNQKEYKLSVMNVRAGSKVISATDVKFTPVDAALPVAQSAQALGNKTIKVTFSEPVMNATVNNFKINNNNVFGATEVTGNVVILKVYNTLPNGEHTLNVTGVSDFSGLKNLSSDLKFTVVEDVTAPTVAGVEKATFEEVTLKFSEPVDKASVLASNIYWMQGSSKRVASGVEAISDDTYKFTFNSTNKLVYTTDLMVEGVRDYSGNAIAANTKVQVSPVIDQTRPEVVNATLKNDNKFITVKFSKNVGSSALTASNYVVKDADGKEVSKLKNVTRVNGDSKTVEVELYQALSQGKKYTLEIAGVADTTTLQNVMLPYSKELTIGDTTAPTVTNVSYVAANNSVVVTFSEVMATSGDGAIVLPEKYSYRNENNAWQTLPSGTTVNVSSDGKSAILVFPSDVSVSSKVKGFEVRLVKDVAGNYLENLRDTRDTIGEANAIALNAANATATNKIEVVFSQALQSGSAQISDFTVTADNEELAVNSAVVDGSKVVLTLSDNNKLDANGQYDGEQVSVAVKANASLATPAGKQIAGAANTTVQDKIAPAIKEVATTVSTSTYAFNVTFTEAIAADANNAYDFEVRVDGKTLQAGASNDYTVRVGTGINGDVATNVVVVDLADAVGTANKGKVVDVRVKPYPSFLKDTAGNLVSGNDSFYSTFIPNN
ncbi:Ig-like domain-containing protein [Paenibacillus sp. JSM ZJ436]|uniref:Ig-like domain-containing protein n=1 Tax=Paenibacillus sp. JSM ZJ436 TaxID=3376190 RepID=UPI0037B8D723